ncbi:MAG: ATP-binding cassette domain-containing protein, partial [Clostridia bacterium]|nr:ATP-binding cassette domain-containing protein [Clostridia bacterium]
KGSKLSGGQKQRTVIARALAKDCPIILADEPTGNLDSKTAKEIIELLREVSKDKLLIVVTHNFDQVQEFATRHVRIYDGAVEFDHVIKSPDQTVSEREETGETRGTGRTECGETCRQNPKDAANTATKDTHKETRKEKRKKLRRKTLKNGFSLGWTVFRSKPKLSAFLCLLLVVGGIGLFLMTSFFGKAITKENQYIFRYIEGRVAITRDAGEAIGNEELENLVKTYGAKGSLRYDGLLDDTYYKRVWVKGTNRAIDVDCTYGETFGDIVGRYPQAENEVLLYLPIYERPTFGKNSVKTSEVMLGYMDLKVVGVQYYYDNNQKAKLLFTEEGFRTATSALYLEKNFNGAGLNAQCEFTTQAGFDEVTGEPILIPGTSEEEFGATKLIPSYDLPSGAAYFADNLYTEWKKSYDSSFNDIRWKTELGLSVRFNKDFTSYSTTITKENAVVDKAPNMVAANPYAEDRNENKSQIYLSTDLVNELAETAMSASYSQASLFFSDDKAAASAAEKLSAAGYIAVPSFTKRGVDPLQAVLTAVEKFALLFVWIFSVLFLGLFIYLCTARAIGAFKGDLAIMRSMGISAKVVRVSMYARMLIALLPAFFLIAAAAFTVFLTPALNRYFVYLYAQHYALIFGGMLFMTVFVTRRQIRKLFKTTVKKSLKGGTEV